MTRTTFALRSRRTGDLGAARFASAAEARASFRGFGFVIVARIRGEWVELV